MQLRASLPDSNLGRALAMTIATLRKTSLEDTHLRNRNYFKRIYFVEIKRCWRWTLQRGCKERRSRKYRFTTVACSSCRQNRKCGIFTLLFWRERYRIVLKSVPHVQHDYFSSFNQSVKFLICGVVVAADVVNAKASISQKKNTNRWLKSIFPRFAPAARGCFALWLAGPWLGYVTFLPYMWLVKSIEIKGTVSWQSLFYK